MNAPDLASIRAWAADVLVNRGKDDYCNELCAYEPTLPSHSVRSQMLSLCAELELLQDDDLDAYIRESARNDPAFATAYLNAEARSTVRALIQLFDSTGAIVWRKIPGGTDNEWLKRARTIDREATEDSTESKPEAER